MIEIRSCAGMDELDQCVELEMETWGYDVTELIPRKTFLLAQKIGGQVIGAFEAEDERESINHASETWHPGKPRGSSLASDRTHLGKLLGFAMSLPGIREAHGQPIPYLHSHMLAVRPECRNRGIGVQLKRQQRLDALARGIGHMEWTFDPLEIKNAFLNIHRLGVVVRCYRENFYGVSSSRLQGGLPTDRLLAEWELASPRVQAFLDRRPVVETAIEERIMVPASIEQWKACEKDRERALAVQTKNRLRFQQAFARGLAVLGFTRDADGNGIYELGIYSQTEQV